MKKQIVLSVTLLAGLAAMSHAQNIQWDGTVGGNFTNTAHWIGGVPSATANIASINGGHIIVNTAGNQLLKAENGGLNGGSMDILAGGELTSASTFEVARKGAASLNIDGGSLTVSSGAFYNGHYADPITDSLTEVKNGGTLVVPYFRQGDGNDVTGGSSTLKLSGAGSTITTTAGNNLFGNGDRSSFTNRVEISGGTMTTAGRDYYGGVAELSISGGLYDANGDQFQFANKVGSKGTLDISGDGELEISGTFYLCGTDAEAAINISGGELRMVGAGRDLAMSNGTGSKSSITMSGDGSLQLVRNLNMHNGRDCDLSLIGSDGSVFIGGDLNAQNAAATVEFVMDENGATVIEIGNRANISDGVLLIDLAAYDVANGTDIVLMDYDSVSGDWGDVQIINGTADYTLAYDIDGFGDVGMALTNVTVIPEPATILLLGLAGGVTYVFRRMRV